jgi:DegV family protein with EDD domain
VTVGIVTDSAAALPPALVEQFGITVVPMWLSVDGWAVPESDGALRDLLRQPERVQTAAPTPGEFEAAIKDRLRTCEGVVVLTIAGTMSATYQAATLAAQAIGGSVRVIDTATAAGAEALVVLAAAELAASGESMVAIEGQARHVIERVRLVATVPTLDQLVRSGRVPGVAAWAGRRLGINPLFEFRAGKVRRLRPALSADAASDRIVALIRRERAARARLHVVALHARAFGTAAALLERVRDEFDPITAFVGEFGPVMVVHTGTGLTGVAWWWEAR